MEIIIHRGSHQIGGCASEIRTATTRIVIDLGSELEPVSGEKIEIPGVTDSNEKCDGVFFTHAHHDHIGLVDTINLDVPLFIGALSKKLLLKANKHHLIYDQARLEMLETYVAGQKMIVGDITITPFLVDHSAFDAHMFLIEAQGKKILHTGDFRSHGFRGKGLYKVLEKHIGEVDLLICEGTVLDRQSDKNMTERDLSHLAASLMQQNKYVFVICASTNIDRIAAFCAAVPRGKYCLCDSYQNEIVGLVKKASGCYSSLYQFNKLLTYGSNLDNKMAKRGFCMFIRLGNPKHQKIMKKYKNNKPLVIYSLWPGYLDDVQNQKYLNCFDYKKLHTSGHADLATLANVIAMTNPKKIIPIHAKAPQRLQEIAGSSVILSVNDKEIIKL